MCAYDQAMKLLDEQLGNRDQLISLSTIALAPSASGKSRPAARIVDAYYEDGAFYVVTSGRSDKMRQIAQNPEVAICAIVENFTADGIAQNLGWVGESENAEILAKLHTIFAAWYADANNDSDPNTCLLRIRLLKGTWTDAHKGIRHEIDFIGKAVGEVPFQNDLEEPSAGVL